MNLYDRLADLRDGYREEARIMVLTSYQPPSTRSVSSWRDDYGEVHYSISVQEEPAAAVGMSLSAPMVSFTAGIAESQEFTSYGPRHPIRQALCSWERICQRKHVHAGPSCGELVRLAISGESALSLSRRFSVGYPRVERVVARGVEYIEDRLRRSVESLTA